jgi:amidase
MTHPSPRTAKESCVRDRAIIAALWLSIGTTAVLGSPAQTRQPAIGFRLLEATTDGIHAALHAKQLTCRALVELYLRRIDSYDKAGPRLNAVQTVNPHALREADRLDAAFTAAGLVGPLHCIPVLVKDQVETSDMPTTFGSVLFKDFVPKRDATIVTRLRNAGAVIIGKSTMGEYAAGYLSSASGPIRNAYDPKRHASGSSGGSGAGVAANFATVGIAEDTGGSTRGPAAVSSLVGLRPTVPLVSRHGMLPARPTTDTLGPIARTVRDAAILLDVIAGYDPNDPVTAQAVGLIPTSYTTFLMRDGLKGARIGVIRQPMDAKANPASEDYRKVKAVIDKAIGDLRTLGAQIVDPVTIPDLADRVNRPWDANVFETEPALNRYLAEHPNAPVKTLRDILLSGKVVPSRVRVLMNNIGRSTEEAGYLQVLRSIQDTRQVVFSLMADQGLDALLYATFDHQPAEIGPGDMTNPSLDTTGVGSNRRLSPILGFPAMAVPAGFTTDGLPVGIEFLARPYAEPTLFKFAYAYEQATRHRKPPASTPALRGEP